MLSFISCFPLGRLVQQKLEDQSLRNGGAVLHLKGFMDFLTPAVLLCLSVLALVGNSYNPFLYFRF